MKKFTSVLLATALGATALTSCGSDNGNEAGNSESESQVVTIGRWGGNEAETAAINQVFADFTEQTGIEVKSRIYTDYNTELQTELIGGTAPDVFYVDAYMAPFLIEQGVLAPLDRETYEIDKFYPNLVDDFEKDGNIYAISKDYSTLALYYNKEWVSEDEIPDTLEELYSPEFLNTIQSRLPDNATALTYVPELPRDMFMAQSGGA